MEHYKFNQNRQCEYFPCHKVEDDSKFNCMFCYCPLYALGENCGGHPVYLENGIKSCENCLVPHQPDGYDHVMKHIGRLLESVRKK